MHCSLSLYLHLYACLACHDAVGQPQRHDLVISNLPHPTLRVPFATPPFDLLPQGDFTRRHPHGHEAVCWPLPGSRVPATLFYNQFHGLEPFFVLFVVPVAHTYQTIPILGKQSFGPTLMGMQCQTDTHSQTPHVQDLSHNRSEGLVTPLPPRFSTW